jgi:hypothetical protein
MKQLLVLLICAVLLSAFSGCQEPAVNRSALPAADKSGVDVLVKGGGQFPPSLAGRWKADRWNWEIVFEPNGVISSVVIPLASAKIRPGQITTVHGLQGEPGIFEPGNIEVCFDPQDNELSIYIKIKRVYMDMTSIAEGSCEYFVIGSVSEDGKIWQADAFTAVDLVVLTPDPNHREDRSKFKKTGDLRNVLGQERAEELLFTKVPDGNASSNK